MNVVHKIATSIKKLLRRNAFITFNLKRFIIDLVKKSNILGEAYKQIGNSVCVPLIQEIARQIKADPQLVAKAIDKLKEENKISATSDHARRI